MIEDLRAECLELADLCETLTPENWQTRTAFHGWTPWDEIAHLLYFDETSLVAAADAGLFASQAKALSGRVATGEQISAIAREQFQAFDGAALVARWRQTSGKLTTTLANLDPKARLPWYGPPMSVRSFVTARLMETWAHGQDIWDLMRRRRPENARLRHIAHLGVSTFGWTFVNRNLPVPPVASFVSLSAPDNEAWTWGDPDSEHRVSGSAQDFCLLVTQRRHLLDTDLQYTSGPIEQWLRIAQCFAGPPADGPPPGVRKVEYEQ